MTHEEWHVRIEDINPAMVNNARENFLAAARRGVDPSTVLYPFHFDGDTQVCLGATPNAAGGIDLHVRRTYRRAGADAPWLDAPATP